jgi:hypothetical protein
VGSGVDQWDGAGWNILIVASGATVAEPGDWVRENAIWVTKTSTATLTLSERLIQVNATSGAVTINLPGAATAGNGQMITVKKNDASANAVILDGNRGETIDGATTYSPLGGNM